MMMALPGNITRGHDITGPDVRNDTKTFSYLIRFFFFFLDRSKKVSRKVWTWSYKTDKKIYTKENSEFNYQRTHDDTH